MFSHQCPYFSHVIGEYKIVHIEIRFDNVDECLGFLRWKTCTCRFDLFHLYATLTLHQSVNYYSWNLLAKDSCYNLKALDVLKNLRYVQVFESSTDLRIIISIVTVTFFARKTFPTWKYRLHHLHSSSKVRLPITSSPSGPNGKHH